MGQENSNMNPTTLRNSDAGLLVAVDGPSGAGKSTVCREIAQRFDAKYLDTGAMYRVATLHVLRAGIDPHDGQAVAAATGNIPLEINQDPRSTQVILDSEDVAAEIRGSAVTQNVSAVAAVPEVRQNLVRLQRELAIQAQRCILDGRDIGTAVFPDAPVKIFLTASAETRAARRHAQNLEMGYESDYETVLADVQRRDHLDANRAVSPLRPAEDAIVVDTSEMSQSEVVEKLSALIIASAERIAQ